MKEPKLQKTELSTRQRRNEHGIQIRMCCASCQHMVFDNKGRRRCCKGYGLVEPISVCESGADYEMRPSLNNAGAFSHAGIKTHEYLMFALELLNKYQTDKDEAQRRRDLGETNYPLPPVLSVFKIRQEYEKHIKKPIYIK